MLATILDQGVAFARDAAAALQIAGGMAWTWIQAQPLWITLSVAAGVKVAVLVPLVVSRRRSRRATSAAAAATPMKSDKGSEGRADATPTVRRPASGAHAALELVSHGVPAIEISRKTGLSRDAVSLLLARSGSMAARQGRPLAAGVAVPVAVERPYRSTGRLA